jgi:hypothetical protein
VGDRYQAITFPLGEGQREGTADLPFSYLRPDDTEVCTISCTAANGTTLLAELNRLAAENSHLLDGLRTTFEVLQPENCAFWWTDAVNNARNILRRLMCNRGTVNVDLTRVAELEAANARLRAALEQIRDRDDERIPRPGGGGSFDVRYFGLHDAKAIARAALEEPVGP